MASIASLVSLAADLLVNIRLAYSIISTMSSFIDGSASYDGPVDSRVNGVDPGRDKDSSLDGSVTVPHVGNGLAAANGTASASGPDDPVTHVIGTAATNGFTSAATNGIENAASIEAHGSQRLQSKALPDKTLPIAIVGMACRFPRRRYRSGKAMGDVFAEPRCLVRDSCGEVQLKRILSSGSRTKWLGRSIGTPFEVLGGDR